MDAGILVVCSRALANIGMVLADRNGRPGAMPGGSSAGVAFMVNLAISGMPGGPVFLALSTSLFSSAAELTGTPLTPKISQPGRIPAVSACVWGVTALM